MNASDRVLVVAAHPDDETLGMGGTWKKLQGLGCEMGLIWMTDGVSSRGVQAKVTDRSSGAEKALSLLQPDYHKHYDFPDNQMDTLPLLQLIQSIESVIAEFKPTIVFTHWEGDLNIDHQLTSRAVRTACRPLPAQSVQALYCFEVLSSSEWSSERFHPNMYSGIETQLAYKEELLSCYSGEMPNAPHARSLEANQALWRIRGAESGQAFAEAFQLMWSRLGD